MTCFVMRETNETALPAICFHQFGVDIVLDSLLVWNLRTYFRVLGIEIFFKVFFILIKMSNDFPIAFNASSIALVVVIYSISTRSSSISC